MSRIHLIGIGGVGMSALAQAFLDLGWSVSGSDRLLDRADCTSTLGRLRDAGVGLFAQDGSGISGDLDAVVYSSAIEESNADWLAAKRAGVAMWHRSEALAHLCQGHRVVAVTGTCGKSSVTAMLGAILAGCGLDPWVINGAEIAGYDAGGRIGSVRRGTADGVMVIEADESDKSLMNLMPSDVIVTNASADHFPKAEADALFGAFCEKASGVILDARDLDWSVLEASSVGWGCDFTWRGIRCHIPMPGVHNAQNGYLALEMAARLGADEAQARAALVHFGGIARRLERIGSCRGACVVDDYAHNPEKLAAAWGALVALAPEGVCGVWRPHGYAPLRKMMADLAAMFNRVVRPQDLILILPVYDAGGTTNRSVSSDDLAQLLRCPYALVGTINDAESRLRDFAAPGCVICTLGARDPDLPRLARCLIVEKE